MKQEKDELQKELDRWKQKYEIAMAFVDIHKKLLNGESLSAEAQESKRHGEKKACKGLNKPRSAKTTGADRTGEEVEQNGDG
jgi:hypothetical protein